MISAALSVMLLLSAGPAAAKEPVMPKITERTADLAAYAAPQGWTAADRVEQGDAQTALTRELHTINIRLAGGAGSRYRKAGDFLAGLEARSTGGKRPEKMESVLVAGQRVTIYRRKVPVSLPPPGEGGPAQLTAEEFCVVQAGKRFFVLTYSYGDVVPDPGYDGHKAWRDFLKTFRLKK
jgi:hypothetical protein